MVSTPSSNDRDRRSSAGYTLGSECPWSIMHDELSGRVCSGEGLFYAASETPITALPLPAGRGSGFASG